MSPKELRELADLIENGCAYATGHVDVLDMHREDYIGAIRIGEEQRPVRQVHETKISIEVTVLGPREVFIRDCYDPQGSWRRL